MIVSKTIALEVDSLDAFIAELIELKKQIRSYDRGTRTIDKKRLAQRKYELMFKLSRALMQMTQPDAERIRKKLWDDFGITIWTILPFFFI